MSWVAFGASLGGNSCQIGLETRIVLVLLCWYRSLYWCGSLLAFGKWDGELSVNLSKMARNEMLGVLARLRGRFLDNQEK